MRRIIPTPPTTSTPSHLVTAIAVVSGASARHLSMLNSNTH
ncbi:hypothetical protein OHV13_06555 [Kitasatospora purpeofusca]